MRPRIAFLVYTGRSGSTYLASQLDGLDGVRCTLESDFVVTLLYLRARLSKMSADEISAALLREEKLRNWGVSRKDLKYSLEQLRARSSFTVSSVTYALLKMAFADTQVNLFVVKSQGVDRHVQDLRRCFDHLKIVHIMRDPRAVYNSQKQRRARSAGSKATMSADAMDSAKRWKRRIRRLRRAGEADLREIRYEYLVAHQKEAMKELAHFLELSRDRRDAGPGSISYFARLPENQRDVHRNVSVNGPIASRINGWVNELDEVDVHLIQMVAGDEMAGLGYELIQVSARSRSVVEVLPRVCAAKTRAALHRCQRWVERAHDLPALRYALWYRYRRLMCATGRFDRDGSDPGGIGSKS